MLYVWCAVVAVAALAEIFSRRLIALWFVPSGIVGLVLSVCELEVHWQIAIVLALGLVGVLLARLFLSTRKEISPSSMIGKLCTVTERVEVTGGCGQVCADGQYWAARSLRAEDVYGRGETVVVVAVEGVKLICKKA